MDYEGIEDDKLPQEVKDKMIALMEMDGASLIEEMNHWSSFFQGWVTICRRREQSDRLERINDGTFIKLAEEHKGSDDEEAGTLMTTLWCMPDQFLDDVLTIYDFVGA